MEQSAYESVIRSLCRAAGIAEWRQLAKDRHFEVGKYLVALLHDEADIRTHQLVVHIELDLVDPRGIPALCLGLLHANARPEPGLLGSFGIDHETGRAVYTVRLDAGAQLDGNTLMHLIEAQVVHASECLARMEREALACPAH